MDYPTRMVPLVGKLLMGRKTDLDSDNIHHCTLSDLDEDILVYSIRSGWFIIFRRKVKGFFMADYSNPTAKRIFKSRAAIALERERHIRYHYYSIHPFSLFCKYWELFMLLYILFFVFSFPLGVCSRVVSIEFFMSNMPYNLPFVLDIILSFFIGYYEENTNIVKLAKKNIAKKYLKTYFFFEVFPCIPFYFLKAVYEDPTKLLIVDSIRFFHTLTAFKLLKHHKERVGWGMNTYKICSTILAFFVTVFAITSIFEIVYSFRDARWKQSYGFAENLENYVYSFYRSILCILLVEYGDYVDNNIGLLLIISVSIHIGFVLKCFILSRMFMFLRRFHRTNTKYQKLLQDVTEFGYHREFPRRIMDRLHHYLYFKYGHHYCNETVITENISLHLKRHIEIYTNQEFLAKVYFFNSLPAGLIVQLVANLKELIFLPNDVIVRADSEADYIFFITYGLVAVYGKSGLEITHLSDGAFFGEECLLDDRERMATTIVALHACELYRLSKSDFDAIMRDNPQHLYTMKERARAKFRLTGKLWNEAKKREDEREAERMRTTGVRRTSVAVGKQKAVTKRSTRSFEKSDNIDEIEDKWSFWR